MSNPLHSSQLPGQGSPTSKPAASWTPNLKGSNLPRAATNGIQQGFSLIYSLRDTANQTLTDLANMVEYGTWLDLIQTSPQGMPNGALWFVTDRRDIVYQVRIDRKSTAPQWFFAIGIQWENTPVTDKLGLNDTGYMVAANSHLTVWNGTAWVTLI